MLSGIFPGSTVRGVKPVAVCKFSDAANACVTSRSSSSVNVCSHWSRIRVVLRKRVGRSRQLEIELVHGCLSLLGSQLLELVRSNPLRCRGADGCLAQDKNAWENDVSPPCLSRTNALVSTAASSSGGAMLSSSNYESVVDIKSQNGNAAFARVMSAQFIES